MDIDGDGITDNLLVAAPMFFSAGMEKGKVYIYRVTEMVGIDSLNAQNTGPFELSFGETTQHPKNGSTPAPNQMSRALFRPHLLAQSGFDT